MKCKHEKIRVRDNGKKFKDVFDVGFFPLWTIIVWSPKPKQIKNKEGKNQGWGREMETM